MNITRLINGGASGVYLKPQTILQMKLKRKKSKAHPIKKIAIDIIKSEYGTSTYYYVRKN